MDWSSAKSLFTSQLIPLNSKWREAAEQFAAFLFARAATVAAVFHFLPHLFPFFTPAKRTATMRAHFLRQIALAYHFSGGHQVSMFSSNSPRCCSVNLRRRDFTCFCRMLRLFCLLSGDFLVAHKCSRAWAALLFRSTTGSG